MNGMVELLSTPAAQRVGWALLHFLWQGTVVALVLAVLLQLLRRRSPQARWAASCLALAVMAALPAVTACVVSVDLPEATPIAEMTGPPHAPEPVAVGMEPPPSLPAWPAADPTPTSSELPTSAADQRPARPWLQRAEDLLHPFLPWAVVAWLAGVTGMSLWHLGGWLQVRRLRHSGARPAGSVIQDAFGRLLQRLRVRHRVRLLESVRVAVPVVVGWLRPVVLLPASALSGLSPAQLEAVLAHELAHIRRWDCFVRLLQAAIETLLFYHPGVWWVSRHICEESENCCDDVAAEVCGDRKGYADALAVMASMGNGVRGVAAAATGGKLLPRIRRIVGLAESSSHGKASWLSAAVLIVALAVTGLIVVGCLAAGQTSTGKAKGEAAATPPAPSGAGTQPATEAPRENRQNAFTFNSKAKLKIYAEYDISDSSKIPHQREVGFTPAASPLVVPAARTSWTLALVGKTHTAELRTLARELNAPHRPPEYPRIWMNYNTTDADLKEVAGLAGLKHLDLFACDRITDAGLAHIGHMKQLEHLSLPSSITDAGLSHVANLARLRHLHLHSCNRITAEGMVHIAGLNRLESLILQDCGAITDVGLAQVARIRGLKALSLIGCSRITNGGLVHISTLAKLGALHLGDCDRITDDGLAHIARMKELSSLTLDGHITAAGLKHIVGLPRLRLLELGKHGTISDEMATRLRAARPGIRIVRAAKNPTKSCSFRGPLEFGKAISIDKEARVGAFHRESYTREGAWVRDEPLQFIERGAVFKVWSIQFQKTLLTGKLLARVKPSGVSSRALSWQVTVRLLDGQGKTVQEASSAVDSKEFFGANGRDIVLSLGRWRGDEAKATGFELLVAPQAQEGATTTPPAPSGASTQPAGKGDGVAWGKAVGGVQVGIGLFDPSKSSYRIGQEAGFSCHARNVTGKTIKLSFLETSARAWQPHVGNGKISLPGLVIVSGHVSTRTLSLPPGEAVPITTAWFLIVEPDWVGETDKALLRARPGKYAVTFSLLAEAPAGDDPAHWRGKAGELVSGELALEIVPASAEELRKLAEKYPSPKVAATKAAQRFLTAVRNSDEKALDELTLKLAGKVEQMRQDWKKRAVEIRRAYAAAPQRLTEIRALVGLPESTPMFGTAGARIDGAKGPNDRYLWLLLERIPSGWRVRHADYSDPNVPLKQTLLNHLRAPAGEPAPSGASTQPGGKGSAED